MFTFILIVVALLADVSESRRHHNRIMGGREAPLGKFPYQVSMQIRNNHLCGGSIISNRYVLTTAECAALRDKKTISVLAGTIDRTDSDGSGVRYKIKNVIVHENYVPIFYLHDIALLETEEKITFGENIGPIAIGKDFVEAGVDVIVSGWGYIRHRGSEEEQEHWKYPKHLHYFKSKTVSNAQCLKAVTGNTNMPIVKSHICTLTKKGEGVCDGDRGSGLANMEQTKLIGIYSSKIDTDCATGFPDIHIRVSEYVRWIERNTK